ncbi:unnamed protein product, partial [Prorocentrum cordatum]
EGRCAPPRSAHAGGPGARRRPGAALGRPARPRMASRFRNVSILLVDVGRSMQEPLPGTDDSKAAGKVTKAGVAVRLARDLVQQKLLFMPKHEVGVVFFGAAATCNDLQADGYANVVAAREGKVCAPDLAALQMLDAQPPGGESSDAVDGLIVSMDMIMKLTGELKCIKIVDGGAPGPSSRTAGPYSPGMWTCSRA